MRDSEKALLVVAIIVAVGLFFSIDLWSNH